MTEQQVIQTNQTETKVDLPVHAELSSATSGSIQSTQSTQCTQSIPSIPSIPSSKILVITITRKQILEHDFSPITGVLDPSKIPFGTALGNLMGRIEIRLVGFADCRNVYFARKTQIYFHRLDSIWPHWLFFCNHSHPTGW